MIREKTLVRLFIILLVLPDSFTLSHQRYKELHRVENLFYEIRHVIFIPENKENALKNEEELSFEQTVGKLSSGNAHQDMESYKSDNRLISLCSNRSDIKIS